MEGCVFCSIAASGSNEKFLAENDSFFAVPDRYPVSPGHALVISKRHYGDFFQMDPEESGNLFKLLLEVKGLLDKEYSPNGYNVTSNIGRVAGQTVFHLHVHVIPRYSGDRLTPEAGGPKTH